MAFPPGQTSGQKFECLSYSKTLSNRARVIIFEIGWGPGCGVGGPGGGFQTCS